MRSSPARSLVAYLSEVVFGEVDRQCRADDSYPILDAVHRSSHAAVLLVCVGVG